MRVHEAMVGPEMDRWRLDRFLVAAGVPLTRSRIGKLIAGGAVLVDGSVATKPGQQVRAGQRVVVREPDPEPMEARPEDIPVHVVFEDEHVVVVNKPAGLVVHPAHGHGSGTLVNALLHRCGDLSGIGGVVRPGIVHRLDRDTSGLLVVTKNDAAHLSLAAQIKARTAKRTYLAVALGQGLPESGVFDTLYGRHPADRKRFSSRVREGKRAVTHCRVVARSALACLLRLDLETGRTHQIRVHLADAGHPVVADPVYGHAPRGREADAHPAERDAILAVPRLALHAARLRFAHPASGLDLCFDAPLPDDMAALVRALFGSAFACGLPD